MDSLHEFGSPTMSSWWSPTLVSDVQLQKSMFFSKNSNPRFRKQSGFYKENSETSKSYSDAVNRSTIPSLKSDPRWSMLKIVVRFCQIGAQFFTQLNVSKPSLNRSPMLIDRSTISALLATMKTVICSF